MRVCYLSCRFYENTRVVTKAQSQDGPFNWTLAEGGRIRTHTSSGFQKQPRGHGTHHNNSSSGTRSVQQRTRLKPWPSDTSPGAVLFCFMFVRCLPGDHDISTPKVKLNHTSPNLSPSSYMQERLTRVMFPLFNLRHLREFESTTYRRGYSYVQDTRYATHTGICFLPLEARCIA